MRPCPVWFVFYYIQELLVVTRPLFRVHILQAHVARFRSALVLSESDDE